MSTIHKLRTILDTREDIFRDIEISASSTLLVLHKAVLQAFGIDNGEMASFYHTDDEWAQGEEIPMVRMDEHPDQASMDQVHVEDLLAKPGDRLLYVYDYLNMWTFFVEFVSVSQAEDDIIYPHVSLKYGETPQSAPGKDFGGGSQGKSQSGLFGDAFDDESQDDDDFDPDELPDGDGTWEG